MALVNTEIAINDTIKRLKKLSPPEGVEVLSYKRKRRVSILLEQTGSIRIIEDGYNEQTVSVTADELTRTLKAIFKTEFPRSRKVRIYHIKGPEALGREVKKL